MRNQRPGRLQLAASVEGILVHFISHALSVRNCFGVEQYEFITLNKGMITNDQEGEPTSSLYPVSPAQKQVLT